jgi:hypothetical protein
MPPSLIPIFQQLILKLIDVPFPKRLRARINALIALPLVIRLKIPQRFPSIVEIQRSQRIAIMFIIQIITAGPIDPSNRWQPMCPCRVRAHVIFI